MVWTLHQVTWRLESPLHSGFAKLGNIQRTRMYITGRMLWGALTARLTRDQASNDYVTVGNAVKENLAFSYGYLCLTEDGSQPLLPVYTEQGLCYRLSDQTLTEREAQRLCLSSYASTALDYANNSAVDGSLHEVEFISPRTLCDWNSAKSGKPLFLTALIAEKENANGVEGWRDACCRLELGGERTYGFGKLTRTECKQLPENEYVTAWFGSKFVSENAQPAVKLQKGEAVTAHTAIAGDCLKVSLGQVEPLIGRTTTPGAEFGKEIELVGSAVYWLPGSVIEQEEVCFKVDKQGCFSL